jgi:hypothetical protein
LPEADRQEECISCPRADRARWGDQRNRGRGEGGLFELPVEVGPAEFPLTQGLFQMQSSLSSLRGMGKLAQIGDLSQGKVGEIVDQVLSFPLNYYNGSTDSKDVSRFLNPYNCAVLNTIIP